MGGRRVGGCWGEGAGEGPRGRAKEKERGREGEKVGM